MYRIIFNKFSHNTLVLNNTITATILWDLTNSFMLIITDKIMKFIPFKINNS
jgi:hypothetical protein